MKQPPHEITPEFADRTVHIAPRPGADRGKLVTDSLSTGFAIMLALTMAQRLVGFMRQLIVCRILDPEELGRWNLANSMILLAAPLLVLGIPGTYGRYSEYFRQKGQLHLFLRRTGLATLVCTLTGAVALMFAAKPVSWLVFRDPAQSSVVYTIAFALVSVIAFYYFIEGLTSLRQVKAVSWMRLACSIMFMVFSLLLLLFFRATATSIVVGYSAACLITAIVGGLVLRRTLRGASPDTPQTLAPSIWSKLLPFAGWIWLADLLANLFAAVDRYMIVHFADATATAAAATVGQYHSSRLIPDQMIAIAALSAGILLPYLSNNWELGDRAAVRRRLNFTLKIYALVMTTGGLLLLVVAPWLFGSVLGGKYSEGLSVTPWSLVACIWFGLFMLTQTYLFCSERAGYCSVALSIGLVGNVALNSLLLPLLGLKGAVIATAVSNACALALISLFAKRFGMRWTTGSSILMALPICLVHGTMFAGAACLALAIVAWFTGLIFDRDEKALIKYQLAEIVARANRGRWLVPAALLGRQRQSTS